MALKLFDRIGTLLCADAHGIIESLEERSLLLKQCVREAEIELNEKRARLETLREDEKRLHEAVVRCENEIASLGRLSDARLAHREGRQPMLKIRGGPGVNSDNVGPDLQGLPSKQR